MEQKLSDFPQIRDAPVDQKIELIDELWEQVRRATSQLDVSPAHLSTLEQRLNAVEQEPALALSPSEARALLRK
jgi:DNA repair ATPase RecN